MTHNQLIREKTKTVTIVPLTRLFYKNIKCCYDILTSKCLFYDKSDDSMAILNFKGTITLFNRLCLSLTPPSVGPCQMSNGQGDLFIIILHINS